MELEDEKPIAYLKDLSKRYRDDSPGEITELVRVFCCGVGNALSKHYGKQRGKKHNKRIIIVYINQ